MKRRVATMCAITLASGAALAQDTVTYMGQVDGGGGWLGGVFKLSSSTGIVNSTVRAGDIFYSFCIELDEFVGNGTYEARVNTYAISGSGSIGMDTDSNVGDGMDELDYRTAYLYSTYLSTAIADSNAARALQFAIWSIEEGIDVQTYNMGGVDQSIRDNAELYLTEAWNEVYGVNGSWGQTWGNVRVLNIGGDATNWRKQDMLIIVPIPQASALAGLGLLGLAVRRRRNTI